MMVTGAGTLFEGGPPIKLQAWLIKADHPNIARRIVAAVLIGWLPLVVLSSLNAGGLSVLLTDFAVHARSLLAVPLLLLADSVCAPRLGFIARHFLDAGLVGEGDRARFETAEQSTRRLRDSAWAEVGVVVLAYAIVTVLIVSVTPGTFKAWHRSGESYSAAAWWHTFVSLPILLVLLLGWMWRLLLWVRFLWLMSRLDLHLIASHPDKAAGLHFVGYSARPWSILGLALGTVVAGRVANHVSSLSDLIDHKYAIAGVVVSAVLLFNAPLAVFTGNLLKTWQRGVFEYGALADEFGRQFERRWLAREAPVNEDILERPDFSAATDLYQVVDRVHEMGLLPVDLMSVGILTIATLLPFVPVVLMAVPFDVVVSALASLLR